MYRTLSSSSSLLFSHRLSHRRRDMSFSNKLFAITGAASGMGRATAHLLASRGALLSISDFNEAGLAAVHEELEAVVSSKDSIFSIVVDVRSTASVNDWITSTTTHFARPLDGAANIAGIYPGTITSIRDVSDAEFDAVMATNTTGVFRCLRAQLQANIMANPGSIVNVGSAAGLVGYSGTHAYTASKHAVHGLTKSVSKEVGELGVRVNAVAPGYVLTPMTANMVGMEAVAEGAKTGSSLKRGAQPEEIAELICWLLSEQSSFVTGSVYRIDGGLIE